MDGMIQIDRSPCAPFSVRQGRLGGAMCLQDVFDVLGDDPKGAVVSRLVRPNETLVGASHQRFTALVREAEDKARGFYQKTLGRPARIEEVVDVIPRSGGAAHHDGDEWTQALYYLMKTISAKKSEPKL